MKEILKGLIEKLKENESIKNMEVNNFTRFLYNNLDLIVHKLEKKVEI